MKKMIFIALVVAALTAVAHADLFSHWKLDEGAGTIAHDSAGSNHGMLFNGPVWTTGQINGALSFNGTTDYIDTGQTFQSVFENDFSFCAFVKLTKGVMQPNAYGFITGAYPGMGSGNSRFAIFYHRWIYEEYYLGAEYRAYGDIISLTETFIANPDVYNFMCVTVKNNGNETATGTFYFNGDVLTTDTEDANMLNFNNTLRNQFIGAYNTATQGVIAFFPGCIDDVRFYDRALSQSEIRALVPEPATLLLLGLGSLALLRKRRT
jgi:hypothetical protein